MKFWRAAQKTKSNLGICLCLRRTLLNHYFKTKNLSVKSRCAGLPLYGNLIVAELEDFGDILKVQSHEKLGEVRP
jgi:hypothetical protein